MIRTLLPASLVVLPLLAALAIPLLAWPWPKLAWPLAIVGAALTMAAAGVGLRHVLIAGVLRYAVGGWAPPWGIELVLDPLSAFVAVVLAAVMTCTLLFGAGLRDARMHDRHGITATLALLLLSGLMGIVVTGDLFNLFVFLEVTALASYALIGLGGGRALVASFRYVIIGSIGASFYLLGVGHLYLVTGTLNMADLTTQLSALDGSRIPPVAVALIVVGLGIKMGVFPLHGWLPDAYTHAPPAASALLAPIATKAAAYALARVVFFVLGPSWTTDQAPLGPALAWLGGLSVLAGGVLAVMQTDFRRLLAYSSVSQIGYIVLGIGMVNGTALTGAYFHVLSHSLTKASLFLVAGIAMRRLGGPRLADLAHMHQRMPLTTLCLVIAALSIIGVPPTAGFFGKWYILLGAVETGRWGLAAIVLAGSLLAAMYMFRVLEHACFEPRAEDAHPADGEGRRVHDVPARPRRREPPARLLLPLSLITAGILGAGLFNVAIVETLLRRALPSWLATLP